ncbi:MAG: copper amine oxidase N-terminal domain-containing protein [Clostridiales bacterium]|jgi:hypothetical protein|nr:copper amine oxidase N-terminal domain-containing protein [Clostridiales bacterium]
MKKLIAIAIAAMVIAGNLASVSAASLLPGNDAAKPKKIKGTITDVTKISDAEYDIEVQSEKDANGDQQIVRLHVTPATYVATSSSGAPTEVKEREGQTVICYYGPIETRSLPPQSNALAVICDISEESTPPLFSIVEEVEAKDDGIRVLTDGGSVWVTIPKDVAISPFKTRLIHNADDVKAGIDLLLWYGPVAMSFPAQATATQVVLLGKNSQASVTAQEEPTETPEASAEPQIAATTEAELATYALPVDETYTEKKMVMVPLRLVVEGLGYVVGWDDATRKVTVAKGTDVHLLNIGDLNYDSVELDVAPSIKDDRTFVPIDFFTKVLGGTYTVKDDAIEFTAKAAPLG